MNIAINRTRWTILWTILAAAGGILAVIGVLIGAVMPIGLHDTVDSVSCGTVFHPQDSSNLGGSDTGSDLGVYLHKTDCAPLLHSASTAAWWMIGGGLGVAVLGTSAVVWHSADEHAASRG